MEVDQLGGFVLAQVIVSAVGQRGDGLSCLPHLEGGGGGVVEGLKVKTLLTTGLYSGTLSAPTLFERTSRPSPRILECCVSSWILFDTALWAGWGRLEAELDSSSMGSAQARSSERARDIR